MTKPSQISFGKKVFKYRKNSITGAYPFEAQYPIKAQANWSLKIEAQYPFKAQYLFETHQKKSTQA